MFHKTITGLFVFAVIIVITTIVVESILLGLIGVLYVKSYDSRRKKEQGEEH